MAPSEVARLRREVAEFERRWEDQRWRKQSEPLAWLPTIDFSAIRIDSLEQCLWILWIIVVTGLCGVAWLISNV